MPLNLVITDAGRAALVNAAHDGTRAVRIAAAGVSPRATVPTPASTTLPGEVKRIATLSGEQVATDVIHIVVQDESADTYPLRSFGLYLEDGTLFALYGQASPIIEKSAQALLLLAIDVQLADITADSIVFGNADFVIPPATVDRRGVIELATIAEAKGGEDANRAVTPATARGAVKDWIGYVPADRAGDTFSGPVSIRHQAQSLGVQVAMAGTGYGFVQFGDAAVPVAARTWHAGSNGDGSFALYQGIWGSGSLRLLVTSAAVTFNGAAMWNAANDGAGSGLDADLLDGRQAAEFALLTGAAFGGPVIAPAMLVDGGDARLVLRNRGNPADDAHGWTIRSEGDFLRFLSPAGTQVTVHPFNGAAFNGPLVAPSMLVDGGDARLVLRNRGNPADDAHGWTIRSEGDVLRFLSPAGLQATLHPFNGFNTSGAITQAGAQVFHTANDGAGSGMDADLLDGQQGSWYADVLGRLGYVPLAASSYTAADVLAKAVTVDGAGSGLDADLLDGRQAAEFALLTGAAFGGPVIAPAMLVDGGDARLVLRNRGNPADDAHGWTIRSEGDVLRFVSPAGVQATLHPSAGFNTSGAITQAGAQVFHTANDGAGSGMDADLLDGQQGAWYADVAARLGYVPLAASSYTAADILAKIETVDGAGSGLDADLLDGRQASEFSRVTSSDLSPNGYRVHDDGFKECWGSVNIPARSTIEVALPVAHTSWVVPTGSGARAAADEQVVGVRGVNGAPPYSFSVRNAATEAVAFYWHTRGV